MLAKAHATEEEARSRTAKPPGPGGLTTSKPAAALLHTLPPGFAVLAAAKVGQPGGGCEQQRSDVEEEAQVQAAAAAHPPVPFRCVPFSVIANTNEWGVNTEADKRTYELSHNTESADYFVSHSWRDDPYVKATALRSLLFMQNMLGVVLLSTLLIAVVIVPGGLILTDLLAGTDRKGVPVLGTERRCGGLWHPHRAVGDCLPHPARIAALLAVVDLEADILVRQVLHRPGGVRGEQAGGHCAPGRLPRKVPGHARAVQRRVPHPALVHLATSLRLSAKRCGRHPDFDLLDHHRQTSTHCVRIAG